MSGRISASELYKIQGEDIRRAIVSFRQGELPPTIKDSNRFDLLVDGYKRFPPKALVALAAQGPFGRVLTSRDLTGGESSAAFRLLLARGFEFATKLMNVAGLDATFSVGRNIESAFVLFESRGPARNTQYVEGLEVLLRGLADMDASIEDIVIDSAETRELPIDQRRLKLSSRGYPLRLRAVTDLSELRLDITRTAAATGRGVGARGPGNPTKRIRIVFTEPEDFEPFRIAILLSQGRGELTAGSKQFDFSPRPPAISGGETDTRKAMDETEVTHIHYQMQQLLYEHLVEVHGVDKVACEAPTASGRPADILVHSPDGYELFEIKTALAPRDCVRQALGQLLEYAYWPGSPDIRSLWIVGPSPLDSQTEDHIDGLRERFGIPLRYRDQPVPRPQPVDDHAKPIPVDDDLREEENSFPMTQGSL